jgi:hypothetical protein
MSSFFGQPFEFEITSRLTQTRFERGDLCTGAITLQSFGRTVWFDEAKLSGQTLGFGWFVGKNVDGLPDSCMKMKSSPLNGGMNAATNKRRSDQECAVALTI